MSASVPPVTTAASPPPATKSTVDAAGGAVWSERDYERAQAIMQNPLSTREERVQMNEWFRRGAAAGHAPSLYEAGAYLCSISESFDEEDNSAVQQQKQGMQFIEEAAQKGYAHAMRYLGMCVAAGSNGQKKDEQRGETLLEQALEFGDGFAGHNLACHLQRKLQLPASQTPKKREELLARIQKAYRRGAELGDPTCQHNLACALADGQDWVGKQDDEEALKWELEAARTNKCVGSRAANYNLGQWYSLGLYGCEPDVNRAIEFWERASTAESYHNLACLYDPRFANQPSMRIAAPELHPQLPAVDGAKAKRFLEQGAKLGNPRSEVMLGFAYQKGDLGCECSPDWALYLYNRARRRGSAQAVERLQLYQTALVMVAQGKLQMKEAFFSVKGKLEFCRMLLPPTDEGPQYFETNCEVAARLLAQIIEEDDSAEAMVELAKLISAPEDADIQDVKRDMDKARQLLQKAADKGSQEAQEKLHSLDSSKST